MSICINQKPVQCLRKTGRQDPVLPSFAHSSLHSFALFPPFSVIFRLTVSALRYAY